MPVAVDGRRRLPPKERKRLLLDYAIDVFASRGIGRGGHTEIAELGGVSVATVFNYFNTREDLVNDVLNDVDGLLHQSGRGSVQPGRSAAGSDLKPHSGIPCTV